MHQSVTALSVWDCFFSWPQGESDAGINQAPAIYRSYAALLTALLQAWRQRLRQPTLAFDLIQLAAYRYFQVVFVTFEVDHRLFSIRFTGLRLD